MKTEETKEETFTLSVMKKNPKPNAKMYVINTTEDFFKAALDLSPKERKRMMKDFADTLEIMVNMNSAVIAIAEHQTGKELPKKGFLLQEWTWIND